MRWNEVWPRLLGKERHGVARKTYHVIATGYGYGFTVNEEGWIEGSDAKALIESGFFVELQDEE